MAARNRYPGLYPFSVEDQAVFFGRDRDLEQLLRSLRLERISVLYGKSGLGKSSLLQAGLAPRLREAGQYEPIFIRLGAKSASSPRPLANLLQVMKEGVGEWPSLSQLLPEEDSLWIACKRRLHATPDTRGLVLIFDQFEEFVTYEEGERRELKQALAEVLNAGLPQSVRKALGSPQAEALSDEAWDALSAPPEVKVLFAIRSDRMSMLNDLTNYLPDVLRNCQELSAFGEEQAREAILEPATSPGAFASPPFGFEPGVVERMLEYLLDEVEKQVEPFQLQILCHYLENKVIAGKLKRVSMQDLGDPGAVINAYYEEQVNSLGSEKEVEAARELIEEGLILAAERRRLTLYQGQIKRDFPAVTDELLTKLLKARLVRAEPARAGGLSYELSHDSLVEPILASREERVLEKQKKKQQFRRAIAYVMMVIILWGGYSLWQERQLNQELKQKQQELEQQLQENRNRIKELSNDIAANPGSKKSYLDRGYAYWALGKADSALRDFSQALEIDHTDKDARYYRGAIYYQQKEYLRAVEDFSRLVSYDSLNAYAHHYLALSLHDWVRTGQTKNDYFPDALEHYNKAIGLYDQDPDFFTNRGNLYLYMGKDSLALVDYQQALSLNPSQVNAYNGQGLVYYRQGKRADAMLAYTRAIRLDSTYPYALRNRAQAFADSGLYALAINDYSRAIRHEPEEPSNFRGRGSLYFSGTQEPAKAVADFTKALELEPENPENYRLRGLAYEKVGNTELAIADFSNAIRKAPQIPVYHVNRGNAYLSQKNFEAALQDFEQAIVLDSFFIDAYLGKANTLEEQGKSEEAFSIYLQAYKADSTNPSTLGNLAWSLLGLGEYTEAERLARLALELGGQEAYWVHTNLAHALLLQGKTQAADSVYQMIQDEFYQPMGKTFGQILLEDIEKLEKRGVASPEWERVKRMLRE